MSGCVAKRTGRQRPICVGLSSINSIRVRGHRLLNIGFEVENVTFALSE